MVSGIRTLLFVPATRPDRFAKAAATGADAVILDLEDAVSPGDKDMARANLGTNFAACPVIVRINARGTPWHDSDVAAVQALGCAGVMLPKSENPGTIAALVDALDGAPVLALVETARGIAQARAIAEHGKVARLAFGSIDLCADLGCAHERDVLLPFRSELVLASRLAGIAPPIDGVTAKLDDPEVLRADVVHAKALGMSGKLCIHPRQIAETAAAMAPTSAEIDWARKILASGTAAASVDGEMVDLPVRLRAQAILDAAGS